MADELEEIKKLPPQERITKLKELEEKRKKEIEKAKELVKESIEEITREEEEKFIEEEVIKEEEERAAKKAAKLEETVEQEAPKLTKEQEKAHRDYIQHLVKEATTRDIYSMVKSLAEEVQEAGYLSMQKMHELSDLERVQQYKQKDIESGKYKVSSEEITDLLSATKNLLNTLRERYAR